MKVINPNLTEHKIIFIPRRYELGTVELELRNETGNKLTVITDLLILGNNGVLSLTFDYTFTEGERYSFKLYDTDGVIYRGRLFVTTREEEATENYITYE